MKRFLFSLFCRIGLAFLCLLANAKADTWAAPQDMTIQSENGQFQFYVALGGLRGLSNNGPAGALRRKSGTEWGGVWTNRLVNQVSPVQAMVHDSGRYVVTFDEYHSVGVNPVVIYGDAGRLIANIGLAELKLEDHPNISRSVSSYWWNEQAIILFGPTNPAGKLERRRLQDSLFIRLYWGEVIVIDLADGKVRDAAWWKSIPEAQGWALKKATDEFLDATWRRLAREYFHKENFEPGATDKGVKGLLLTGQLRLREGLPLAREIAATDRFKFLAAPRWKQSGSENLQALARAVVAEIE